MKKNQASMFAVVAMALMAVAFVPGVASAQDFQGSITLPCATHWGNRVLPAGEYQIRVERTNPHGRALFISNERGSMSLTALADTNAYLKGNYVTIQRTGDTAVVTGMSLSKTDTSLTFTQSRASKGTVVAQIKLTTANGE